MWLLCLCLCVPISTPPSQSLHQLAFFSSLGLNELELELIQSHMGAQKPMLRGEVGARVRVIRACDQRRERKYGRARTQSNCARKGCLWLRGEWQRTEEGYISQPRIQERARRRQLHSKAPAPARQRVLRHV